MKPKTNGRTATPAAALLAGALAGGCTAVGPMSMVDADERDESGAYDGTYRLRLAERPRGFQNVGRWRMSCGTGGFDLPMTVRDGTARLGVRFDSAADPGAPITSHVAKGGGFRFEVPMSRPMQAAGTSSSTLDNGAVKLIYQGELAEDGTSRGLFTQGVAEFGYAGCAHRFEVVPEA